MNRLKPKQIHKNGITNNKKTNEERCTDTHKAECGLIK